MWNESRILLEKRRNCVNDKSSLSRFGKERNNELKDVSVSEVCRSLSVRMAEDRYDSFGRPLRSLENVASVWDDGQHEMGTKIGHANYPAWYSDFKNAKPVFSFTEEWYEGLRLKGLRWRIERPSTEVTKWTIGSFWFKLPQRDKNEPLNRKGRNHETKPK